MNIFLIKDDSINYVWENWQYFVKIIDLTFEIQVKNDWNKSLKFIFKSHKNILYVPQRKSWRWLFNPLKQKHEFRRFCATSLHVFRFQCFSTSCCSKTLKTHNHRTTRDFIVQIFLLSHQPLNEPDVILFDCACFHVLTSVD